MTTRLKCSLPKSVVDKIHFRMEQEIKIVPENIKPKKFIGNEFFAEGRYIKCFYKTFYIAGLTPGNL